LRTRAPALQDPACGEDVDFCLPSIAPASLEYLPADHAPNAALANVLLVPALKTGSLFVFKLSGDGNCVQGDTQQLFRTRNRYRDTAVSPDHTKIYIATDSHGQRRAAVRVQDRRAGQLPARSWSSASPCRLCRPWGAERAAGRASLFTYVKLDHMSELLSVFVLSARTRRVSVSPGLRWGGP